MVIISADAHRLSQMEFMAFGHKLRGKDHNKSKSPILGSQT